MKGCDFLKTICLTQNLSELLRQFRIRNGKSAKDISYVIDRTPSYLSKLESGMTKKIDSSLFECICNAINETEEDGIVNFISFAFQKQNISNLDADTILTLANIDDILYKFYPPNKYLEYVNNKMSTLNISIGDLVAELNRNRDLESLPSNTLNNIEENLYSYIDDSKEHIVIKLHYNTEDIVNILNGSQESNYVTLNAILYTIYKLSGLTNDNANIKAINTLNDRFKIISNRKKHIITINSTEDEEKYLGVLEPQVEQSYQSVMEGIRLALLISQNKGGSNRIEKLRQNLADDLGFTFAYISADLSKITSLPKKYKKEFIQELQDLIQKYSSKTDEDIDFYFDE